MSLKRRGAPARRLTASPIPNLTPIHEPRARALARAQIDCFPLPIPCFYTVYAEGRGKPFIVTETSAAFYLSPVNPPAEQASDLDIKRSWCAGV